MNKELKSLLTMLLERLPAEPGAMYRGVDLLKLGQLLYLEILEDDKPCYYQTKRERIDTSLPESVGKFAIHLTIDERWDSGFTVRRTPKEFATNKFTIKSILNVPEPEDSDYAMSLDEEHYTDSQSEFVRRMDKGYTK